MVLQFHIALAVMPSARTARRIRHTIVGKQDYSQGDHRAWRKLEPNDKRPRTHGIDSMLDESKLKQRSPLWTPRQRTLGASVEFDIEPWTLSCSRMRRIPIRLSRDLSMAFGTALPDLNTLNRRLIF
jgi:hypothetical protein